MTSLHLQRGMIKVWRVERTRQSVCRPSNEESSTCPGTVVLLPSRHFRSIRSSTPQPCTLEDGMADFLHKQQAVVEGLKTLMPGLDNSRHWSESGTWSPSWDQVPRKLSAWKIAETGIFSISSLRPTTFFFVMGLFFTLFYSCFASSNNAVRIAWCWSQACMCCCCTKLNLRCFGAKPI